MMNDDPSPDISPGSVDPSSKCCEDCRTTTTPLWRAGPSGPKSLCNACGIRYRKNRRTTAPGLKKEKREITAAAAASTDGSEGGEKFKLSLKLQISGLWAERPMIQKKRRWRRRSRSMLGEEEQAAVLLMALSSGFFCA